MIRLATRLDIPALVVMMQQYAQEAPPKALQQAEVHDANYVTTLLFQLLVGRGFIFIDNDSRGFIAAIKTKNIWCPDVIELRELAWWVHTDHRNKTLGGKLWLKFDEAAQELLDTKEINYVCTTVMANSQLIDYTKRGYKPLEATFYRD